MHGRYIMQASAQGHLDVVLLLLEHGASVDAVDSIGASALHSACQFNRFDCVQYLVKEGADVGQAGLLRRGLEDC